MQGGRRFRGFGNLVQSGIAVLKVPIRKEVAQGTNCQYPLLIYTALTPTGLPVAWAGVRRQGPQAVHAIMPVFFRLPGKRSACCPP